MNGPSAKPKALVLPNAPIYAPRTSSGASAATIAWDVGTHNISPTTKTNMESTNIPTDPLRSSNRNEPPIRSIALTSFASAA
jgi:hypothetical protein